MFIYSDYFFFLSRGCFFQSTSNSLSAGSLLRRGKDTNTLSLGSRGSLTDAAIQSEGGKKAVTMTEYEHMEMNPISPARAGCFSPPLLSLARSLSIPAACLRP